MSYEKEDTYGSNSWEGEKDKEWTPGYYEQQGSRNSRMAGTQRYLRYIVIALLVGISITMS